MEDQRTENQLTTPELVAAAFNEWMRRYTETPEEFNREFETVGQFLKEEADGQEPSYGAWCAQYLALLMDEIANPPRREVVFTIRIKGFNDSGRGFCILDLEASPS